jgi:hypothetical protein
MVKGLLITKSEIRNIFRGNLGNLADANHPKQNHDQWHYWPDKPVKTEKPGKNLWGSLLDIKYILCWPVTANQ